MPPSEAQLSELSQVSALSEIRPGETIFYATPFAATTCEGTRNVPLGGVLLALDDDRPIALVADGAEVAISCATPSPFPSGARWVAASAPWVAAGQAAADYAADLPELVRAASVSGSADVSLLPFSYDPLPIERWRYDACESLGRCPARAIPQPTGSIRRPAVGMRQAGVSAFCASRGLRALRSDELQAVADSTAPLIESAEADVVVAGFRCARSEPAATTP